jgi:hypothetical protein
LEKKANPVDFWMFSAIQILKLAFVPPVLREYGYTDIVDRVGVVNQNINQKIK